MATNRSSSRIQIFQRANAAFGYYCMDAGIEESKFLVQILEVLEAHSHQYAPPSELGNI